MWQLIAPRFTVCAAAAAAAYTLGTLAAWYETALLLGQPPAGAMLAGLLCGSVFLTFAVSVCTAAASVARSTLGTVGTTLGVLLGLPILGIAGPLHAWLPSTLITTPIGLLGHGNLGDYLPALAITELAAPCCWHWPPHGWHTGRYDQWDADGPNTSQVRTAARCGAVAQRRFSPTSTARGTGRSSRAQTRHIRCSCICTWARRTTS
jgi:hypothetical protein